MNIIALLKYAGITAAFAVFFLGINQISTDLQLVGTVLAYGAAVVILGLAALDGARRVF